jgi:hypothetical protein
MSDDTDKPRGGWLARWRAPRQQTRQLATLQDGFNELVGLTRSIREHMETQALTQRTLVEMMEHLPGAVEGLKSVGTATQQQTETLNLLKQQLEAAARNEDHLIDSMRSFNKTLTMMDSMSKSTTATVKSMAERTRDSEEMLRGLLERSERRLIYMIVTLMVVTVGVLGVGLYVGLGGHAGTEPVPVVAPAEVEAPQAVEPEPAAEPFQHQKSISELGDDDAEVLLDEAPVELDEDAVEPVAEEVAEGDDADADPEVAAEVEGTDDDREMDDAEPEVMEPAEEMDAAAEERE